MNELQLKQLALLEDTVKYYSDDTSRRASSVQQCYYRYEDKCCAVGRLIPDDCYREWWDEHIIGVQEIFNELPENVQVYTVKFLKELQILHDDDLHWDKNGLTEEGDKYVETIKEQFNLN